MIDIQDKKDKIISFLNTNGPSLPVRIAKIIEMEPVFAAAITSELIGSKQVKTSHLKVGASPLYFLPGQEQKLEEHTENLKSAEKEAYLKLKKNKLIVDKDESPIIRVALRNIKDFAIPFDSQEKTMWKYVFSSNEEIEKLLSSSKEIPKPENEPKEDPKLTTEGKEPQEKKEVETEVPKAWLIKQKEIKQAKEESKKIENIFTKQDKNILTSLETESKKPEPEFLTEIKNFLKQKNIKFLEEIRTEKKEVMATVNITSQLGNINFLLIAKNKKAITKDEIEAAIQIATKNKMPCLLIIKKDPSRPIQKLINENNLIKLEVMK